MEQDNKELTQTENLKVPHACVFYTAAWQILISDSPESADIRMIKESTVMCLG